MKISLHRTGGFAGIAMNAAVETASLAPSVAKHVEQLVSRLPSQAPPPAANPKARDAFTYEIQIDGRTYQADDSTMPEEWRPLVDWLIAHS
jgi:hypothetical protein